MSGRNARFVLIALLIVVMSFIGLYAGHFLFNEPPDTSDIEDAPPEKEVISPITYRHFSTQFKGYIQEIDVLEFNTGDRRVKLRPVLSFDRIFGYELLSEMAERHKAYAAVNGGFFHEYGYPSGMVVIDGKLITDSTGLYPVFIVNDGTVALKTVDTKLWLESGGNRTDVDGINSSGSEGRLIVYTPDYGLDNRVKVENTTAVIQNGIVKDVARFSGAVDIPEDGMLATMHGPAAFAGPFGFKIGDRVEFKYDPFLGSNAQAYECGSWILREGKLVIGEKDAWVGVLTNRDPRTVAAIKENGTAVLLTVDGRQPGYSTGMTGGELGEFLLSLGIRDAAMLDGGASTEMIIEGRIINRPSFKGQERPLAGGIILQLGDEQK